MTKKELIAYLADFPDDTQVLLWKMNRSIGDQYKDIEFLPPMAQARHLKYLCIDTTGSYDEIAPVLNSLKPTNPQGETP